MLIPSVVSEMAVFRPSLSRRVNANSQHGHYLAMSHAKLIKKGEC